MPHHRALTLTAEASLNYSSVELTAAIRRGAGRMLFGAAAHAALPASSSNATALTFIHGYRHRHEWRLFGQALSLSSHAWLLASQYLLLFCNDVSTPMGDLLLTLARDYPQTLAAKLLVHTPVNIGYRCGHIHSLALTQSIWRHFDVVLFAHPEYAPHGLRSPHAMPPRL